MRIYYSQLFLVSFSAVMGLVLLFVADSAKAILIEEHVADIHEANKKIQAQTEKYARRFRRFQNRLERRRLAIRHISVVDPITRRPQAGLHRMRARDEITINVAQLSTLNVRANVRHPHVGSVRFFLDGRRVNVSNQRPHFMMENRRARRNLPPATWSPTPGTYVVRAVAFSEPRRRGVRGRPRSFVINVVNEFEFDPSAPPLEGLSQWEQNMQEFGALHCDENTINELSTFEGSVWYYDGIWVYYQIAEWLNDPSWEQCAAYVRSVYRDYVLASGGTVPGWRVFPDGLYEDFVRTGDPNSREAVRLLATDSAFAHLNGGRDHELSRETAQLINAFLRAEQIGEPLGPRLNTAVDYSLAHLRQWTATERAEYVHPYRVGITMEALIRYYERSRDNRIPPAIEQAANWLWENMWDPNTKSFYYVRCQPGSNYTACNQQNVTAPDLNMLIAPAYAWLWNRTGVDAHRERGDLLFQGGLETNFLQSGKHFSQNYRWAFDFVRWRLGTRH